MTLAELYQEAARVAKLIEGTKLTIGDAVKICGHVYGRGYPAFDTGNAKDYEFALAIVDGRPAFRNDWIYFKGEKYSANDQLFKHEALSNFSWNPPKPRTVMVELLREDAERCKEHFGKCYSYSDGEYTVRVFIACQKALEE